MPDRLCCRNTDALAEAHHALMRSGVRRRSAWLENLSALLLITLAPASATALRAPVLRDSLIAERDPSNPFTFATDSQCSYSLSTTTVSAPASGGYYAVNVVTRPGCDWTVGTALDWVTLSTTGGVGRGTVAFEIQVNASSSRRSGTIEIGGQTLTVQQGGSPPCDFSVLPTYVRMPAAGGNGELSVDVRSGCEWTVSSSEDWLAPAVTRGTGPAKISFTAKANDEKTGRTAMLTVGPSTIWVSQNGRLRIDLADLGRLRTWYNGVL